MPGPNKKSKSRQLFEEVFDQQARRFSAFDLLGLTAESSEVLSNSPTADELKNGIGLEDTVNKEKLTALVGPTHVHRSDSHTHTLGNDTSSLAALSKSTVTPGMADVLGGDGHTDIQGTDEQKGENEGIERRRKLTSKKAVNISRTHTKVHRTDRRTLALRPDQREFSQLHSQPIASPAVSESRTLLRTRPRRNNGNSELENLSKGKEQVSEHARQETPADRDQTESTQLSTSTAPTGLSDIVEEKESLESGSGFETHNPVPPSDVIATSSSTEEVGRSQLDPSNPVESSSINSSLNNSMDEEQNLSSPLGTDGLSQGQTVDGLGLHGTDGLSLGQTVCPSLGQTQVENPADELGADGHTLEKHTARPLVSILLAPVQWTVWQALLHLEAANAITSYRQIAKTTKCTLNGVRKAIRIIEREGGIVGKETVRTAQMQGFRFKLNRSISFHKGTVNQAKAILKRGLSLAQTPDRASLMLGPDRLRMFVCKNINIKQTDVVRLLSVTPRAWAIREQTLTQIAELLPDMTAIEFRLSLAYLVEQAKTAKQPIRNHNAWVKAAFEKSGAPLVTERDIEAQFTRTEAKDPQCHPEPRPPESEPNDELRFLRLYLTCPPEERTEIDRIADQKAAPLLKVVGPEHREGVLKEARIEAVREFFSNRL